MHASCQLLLEIKESDWPTAINVDVNFCNFSARLSRAFHIPPMVSRLNITPPASDS
jgi:hypothetical protein